MLIRFSVDNFKSFNKTQTFDTLAYNRLRNKDNHKISVGKNDLKLLRLSLLFGGNASGKSNFIDAINYAKNKITDGIQNRNKELFCKTNKENEKKESKFVFTFSIDDKYYMYGFSILLKEERIVAEWLYELKGTTLEEYEVIFERVLKNSVLDFSDTLFKDENDRINTYKKDYANNDKILLLNELNSNKIISEKSSFHIFNRIYNWFNYRLKVIKPNQPINSKSYILDETTINKIEKLIKAFDTGIEAISSKKISFNEFTKSTIGGMPTEIAEEFIESLEKNINDEKNGFAMLVRNDKGIYGIKGINGELSIKTLVLSHHSNDYKFNFTEESDGTQRIFDLINILIDIEQGSIFVIDELERSLHPTLTRKFLEIYLDEIEKANAQLIFTTHESCLLDQELIRRDEVWFLERDYKGESVMFPLRKFKNRYDLVLDKAYLNGRYGGLPSFKDFKELEG